jgi:hypothetical protein
MQSNKAVIKVVKEAIIEDKFFIQGIHLLLLAVCFWKNIL